MSQDDYLRDELYPKLYSGYNEILDGIYSAKGLGTNTERHDFLRSLQEPAKELWDEYRKPEISPDYQRLEYQIVYLLRYFLPYSLPVPTVLSFLMKKGNFSECLVDLFNWTKDSIYVDEYRHNYLDNRQLIASLFGCGPCPELYGLMHYLKGGQIGRIDASMFDRCAGFLGWEYSREIVFQRLLRHIQIPRLDHPDEFAVDIAAPSGLGDSTSERKVETSDLIIFQFCLNEIPALNHEHLKTNLIHVVDLMKPGALMLIVERFDNLLGDIYHRLDTKFSNSIRMCYEFQNTLHLMDLNQRYVPKELTTHLLQPIFGSKTWLAKTGNVSLVGHIQEGK